jgi:geranylgeranyl pyrophosphate synthase
MPPVPDGELSAQPRAFAALDWLDGLVDELPVTPTQAGLFRLQIEEGRREARAHPLPAAYLSDLAHAAVGGEAGPAPLTGACLCVFLGADLFDNVVDDELPDGWLEAGPVAATLTAVTFLALVWKALGRLGDHGAPAERIGALVDLFADRLLQLSSGEQADLAGPASPTTEHALAIAEAKSGTQFALYTRAGAMLAGATPEQAGAYAEYGSALGTGSQLMSDLADICQAPPSDDLRNGALTLPVVHALAGEESERLTGLLEAARNSEEAQAEVRAALIRAGSPRYVGDMTSEQRRRALDALDRADARDPAAAELRKLVDTALEVDLVERCAGSSDQIAEELRLLPRA